MKQMIRVLIADDHPIVRQGLQRLFEQQNDIRIVGEASDGHQVLQLLERCEGECDVLVLDLSLPRRDGLEVLRRVRADYPALRVLVLSMYPADQYKDRLLEQGAAAYIGKDESPDELLQTLRTVANGGVQRSEDLSRRQARRAAPHTTLTAREYQVFTLIFAGQQVSDIAAELNLSPSTISNHVAKIREKLGVRSIGEIVRYAHEVGIAGSKLGKK